MNLSSTCYLVQPIIRHLLMFIRDYVFHEPLTWFMSVSKDLDNASSNIQNVSSQFSNRNCPDSLLFFIICGLLFSLMILSATFKNEATYDTGNIETISMTELPFAEDPLAWNSRSSTNTNLRRCLHAFGNLIGSHYIVPEQALSCPPICSILSHPETSSCNVHHSGHSQNSKKKFKEIDRPVSHTIPQEWLVRRTRSGHIYGKYPTHKE